jgi:hypothetical protein
MTVIVLVGVAAIFAQVVGSPIVQAPAQAPAQTQTQAQGGGGTSITVNAPPLDPIASQALFNYNMANTELDHGSVPVTWASSLLSGNNIWTQTPLDHLQNPAIRNVREKAHAAALALFVLAIIWTGIQLALGTGLGTTSYQQLFPVFIAGFLICAYADPIVTMATNLNNWLCSVLGGGSLADFSSAPLELPDRPVFDSQTPVPVAFFMGLIGSFIYAIVLILLELKLIFREAVLWITTAAMPIAGVLWAVEITKGWGGKLLGLFFGWLFGQPLLVLALGLASSLLTVLNLSDGAGAVLVKFGILIAALKIISIFAPSGLGSGFTFGLAGMFLLMRRMGHFGRNTAAAPPAQQPAAAVQPGGPGGGTGGGGAATGRPWRPALGTA